MIKLNIKYVINKDVLMPKLYDPKEIDFANEITSDMSFTLVRSQFESNRLVIKPENSCEKLRDLFNLKSTTLFVVYEDEVIPAKKLKFINEINNL